MTILDHSYNSNNQLTSYDSVTFNYDKNGNLTKKTQNGTDISTYTFDYENKITRIDYPNSEYSAYKYDALGRRIEKRDRSGNISRYYYDGQNFIAEYDGSNNLVASYVQGLGIDNPISMYRGGQMYWYHSDALGSIYQMTDSSQTVAKSYDYSAFGKIISETGNLANPFSYAAREFDSESGLYYYRARYYDAAVGRFLGRDPIISTNTYYYVKNRPTMRIDPSGMCESSCNKLEYLRCVRQALDDYIRTIDACQATWALCSAGCIPKCGWVNPECIAMCELGCETVALLCYLGASLECILKVRNCAKDFRCEPDPDDEWCP